MAATRTLLKADDLPALDDDGRRHELIAGELRTLSRGGEEHGDLAALFTTYLNIHVLAHKLGRVFAAETGFLLATDPDTVRAPDVAFVSADRLRAEPAGRGYRRGAPDLVVAIVAPHDRYIEVEQNVDEWLLHSAQMVIVVNPRRRTLAVRRFDTEVRHLTIDDTLEGENVVPGWTMPVRDLFR